ncbi:triacylglycerol lipase 1-like isoform X2 [Cucumis melo]|uniref:Triacylglycerol lipase 1-like isoform X2 n=1 Tax=Cucumis melo TaxID=3656 RepID=A0ABM3KMD9_CUCME|nr:triacylglycerol lipase 1-like isoform X2 [Cucumis melo]
MKKLRKVAAEEAKMEGDPNVAAREFWNWSWEELALYNLAEMINYINSLTNRKIYIVGHSQGTIMSFAALTQPEIAKNVEAAALLSPISYLKHITAPLVRLMVDTHLDTIFLPQDFMNSTLKAIGEQSF